MKARPKSAHPSSRPSSGVGLPGPFVSFVADSGASTSAMSPTHAFSKKAGAIKDKQRIYNASMLSEKLKDKKVDEPAVVFMGIETHSYIGENDSLHGSPIPGSEPPPTEVGEISCADALRIDAFHRLKSRKTQLLLNPSLQKDMRMKRSYKDNKIVAGLANHRPGFVRNHREERLASMDENARNAYLSRLNSDFTASYRPKFLDFTSHNNYSSKIENIPRFVAIFCNRLPVITFAIIYP